MPRSEIAGHVRLIHKLEKKYDVPLPTYGHAADGNIHTHSMRRKINDGIIGDEIDDWQQKHEQIRAELYNDTIKRKGIISGEHGIGRVKRDFLVKNIGTINIELMNAVKKSFDPRGILNPGIIY